VTNAVLTLTEDILLCSVKEIVSFIVPFGIKNLTFSNTLSILNIFVAQEHSYICNKHLHYVNIIKAALGGFLIQ
jgi:hypothetical protein